MRLDWLISIPDPTHPHFLPLEKIAAARRYNWWLGVQELSHDFTEIEQLDAQLMFERFNGNWDFDMAVPPMLLTTISQRRPTDSQQCLICHTSGHCIDQCAKVTGIALLRRTNDKSEEHHAAYDDDENDAENDKDEREVCWDWNTRQCDYYDCKYDHRCAECGGAHPKKNCAVGDMNTAKAAADDTAPSDD
jgi:hypothetical protein